MAQAPFRTLALPLGLGKAPLWLEQYLDLVRPAVKTRHRVRGDVELTVYDRRDDEVSFSEIERVGI